jgi:galactokinase
VKDFLLSKLEQHPCFHRPKDISEGTVAEALPDSDLNEISLQKIHISRCPGRLSFSKHCDYVNNDLLYLAANYETLVAVQVSTLALGEISTPNVTAQAFIEIHNLNPDFQELILSQDQVIEDISAIKLTISNQCLNENKPNWTFYILKILDLLSKEDFDFDLAKILSLRIVVNSDLPAASGMSSSHALILASLMSLIRALHSQGLLKNIDKTYFRYLLNSGAEGTNDLLDLLKFCQKVEIAKGFNSGLGDQAAQILSRKNYFCFIKLFPELSFKYQKIPEGISFMILPSFIKAEKTSEEYRLKEKYFDRYKELNQLTPFFLENETAHKRASSLGDILYKLTDKEILEKLKKLKETQDDKKLSNLALYALAEGARLKDLKQNFYIEKMFEHVNLSHLAEWVSDSSPHPMIFSADLKLGNTIFAAQESINMNLKLANHIGAYRSSTLFNDSLQSFTLSLEGVYACSIMGAGLGGNNIAVVSTEKIDSIKKTLIEDFYSHYNLAEKAKTAILVNSSANGLEYLGEF